MMPGSTTPPPKNPLPTESADTSQGALPRRDFIKVAGAGAGLLLVGKAGVAEGGASTRVPGLRATRSVRSASASPDIVVIGAGAWGSFTSMNLRKMGAKVTMVDSYGPGNSRSTIKFQDWTYPRVSFEVGM